MPRKKQYYPCPYDINLDSEAWELTEEFGDRSLRLWLEILSSLHRDRERFNLSWQWIKRLSDRTHLKFKTVAKVLVWAINHHWIEVIGPLELKAQWIDEIQSLDEVASCALLDDGWADSGKDLSLKLGAKVW